MPGYAVSAAHKNDCLEDRRVRQKACSDNRCQVVKRGHGDEGAATGTQPVAFGSAQSSHRPSGAASKAWWFARRARICAMMDAVGVGMSSDARAAWSKRSFAAQELDGALSLVGHQRQ